MSLYLAWPVGVKLACRRPSTLRLFLANIKTPEETRRILSQLHGAAPRITFTSRCWHEELDFECNPVERVTYTSTHSYLGFQGYRDASQPVPDEMLRRASFTKVTIYSSFAFTTAEAEAAYTLEYDAFCQAAALRDVHHEIRVHVNFETAGRSVVWKADRPRVACISEAEAQWFEALACARNACCVWLARWMLLPLFSVADFMGLVHLFRMIVWRVVRRETVYVHKVLW
jgi:hypothetical protein